MSIEFPIGKTIYKINCSEDEKQKLVRLSHELNQRVNKVALQLKDKNIDEKTLLVITALSLEEELENAEKGVLNSSENYEENRLNEQDLYDAVSENMENVANYVNKIINKIQNL
jgi:cell division protein ZapA (FtsZ GTPase activity inhibitor)